MFEYDKKNQKYGNWHFWIKAANQIMQLYWKREGRKKKI